MNFFIVSVTFQKQNTLTNEHRKKSHLRETLNFSTDADSSSDSFFFFLFFGGLKFFEDGPEKIRGQGTMGYDTLQIK